MLAGSSGSIRFTDLDPGRYSFRVAAGESRAEKGIERRKFEIPPNDNYCTTHLINEGIAIGFGGQVTVEFAGVGPATEFMCRLDRQPQFSCEFSDYKQLTNHNTWFYSRTALYHDQFHAN